MIRPGRSRRALVLIAVLLAAAPAYAGFDTNQAAAVIFGQPGFNVAGIDAWTMRVSSHGFQEPWWVEVSTPLGKTFVADRNNHRVLIYNATAPVHGQVPDLVLGHTAFDHYVPNDNGSNVQGGVSASNFNQPMSVAVIGTSKLAVADYGNNRVLIWSSIPTSNYQAANVVLGQVDMTGSGANSGGPTASTFANPIAVTNHGDTLLVADHSNHRVLIWSSIPTSNAAPANRVVGQPNFASIAANSPVISSKTFNYPGEARFDGTRLFVADVSNQRVLIWNSMPASDGKEADIVVGHPNFTNTVIRDDGNNVQIGPTANNLCNPYGVYSDGTKLYVPDNCNQRVLIWNSIPSVHFASANVVVGQPTFLNADALPARNRFYTPLRVIVSSGSMFVAEVGNHRISQWSQAPTSNFSSADRALGHLGIEGEFLSGSPNAGPSGRGLHSPCMGMAAGGKMIVADLGNHRALLFDSVPAVNGSTATRVLGQPDFWSEGYSATTLPGYGIGVSSHFYNPEAAYTDGVRFFVSDSNNNRVLIWKSFPAADNQPADLVLGQPDLVSNLSHNGGVSAASMGYPIGVHYDGRKLFLSDYNGRRVLIWNSLPSSNFQPADVVLGHTAMNHSAGNDTGSNVSGPPSAYNTGGAYGVFSDGQRLFLADSGNNRVLIWNSVPASNFQPADVVLGHPDFSYGAINDNGSNVTGAVSASNLYFPISVFSDGRSLYVADYNNHRVLMWDKIPASNGAPANRVLGQSVMTTANADCGQAAGVQNPRSVFSDGPNLYVPMTGCHSVKIWKSTVPVADRIYLSVSSVTIPGGTLAQGESKAFLRVDAYSGGGVKALDSIRVYKDGAAADSSLRLKLYIDNLNNGSQIGFTPGATFGGDAEDSLTDSADFAGSSATLNADLPVEASTVTVWLALSLKDLPYPTANLPQAAMRVIPNYVSFQVKSGELGIVVSTWTMSNLAATVDTSDTLQVSSAASPGFHPYAALNTADHPMALLSLRTASDYAYLRRLKVYKTGSSDQSDQSITLHRDINSNGVYDPGTDAALSVGTSFVSGGTATVVLTGLLELSTTPVSVWIVGAIAGNGSADGKSFGVSVDTTSFVFDIGSVDVASGTNLPYLSPLLTVAAAIVEARATNASTGAWTNSSTFTFSGNFGQQNVAWIRYAWDKNPAHAWTNAETLWSSGNSTVTAASDGSWYFHARAYDSFNAAGSTTTLGPFLFDATLPTASAFGTFNLSASSATEGQFVDLVAGVTAQAAVQDLLAGLAGPPVRHAGTVARLDFEEGSGTLALDSSGSDNHATMSATNAWGPGYSGGGLASGFYATISTPAVAWPALTVMGWVRPTGLNVGSQTLWASRQFRFQYFTNDGIPDRVRYNLATTAGGGCGLNTVSISTAGLWTHVALVISPAENRVYVNGQSAASCAGGGTPGDTRFRFGLDGVSFIGAGDPFTGEIDRSVVVNAALTQAQVQEEISASRSVFAVYYSSSAGAAWSVSQSTVPAASPYLSAPWGPGSTNAETLKALNLTLVQSTNSLVCGGAQPCGATNQVRFVAGDRAGNVRSFGPFAVLIDSLTAVALSTAAHPPDGAYVNQTNFSWSGPSTSAVYGLQAGASFFLEVSNNDPSFAPANLAIRISTPAVAASTMSPTIDGLYLSTYTLTDATTYYWRVALRSRIGSQSPWSAASKFITDLVAPTPSSFVSVDASGASLDESLYNDLARGVTAQLSLQDLGSGLAVSSAAIGFSGDGHSFVPVSGGFGVLYSTNSGQSWVDGSTHSVSHSLAAGESVRAFAVFQGRLYAGARDGGGGGRLYSSADGASWSSVLMPNSNGVVTLAVHKGKLFAAAGGAIYESADGSAWLLSASIGVTVTAVHNGKLYAGGSGFHVLEGGVWRNLTETMPPPTAVDAITSMAVYNGALYIGTHKIGQPGIVWRYLNGAWFNTSFPNPYNGVGSLGVYNGRLYAGSETDSAPGSFTIIYAFDGTAWMNTGFSAAQTNIGSLSLYAGKLYAAHENNGLPASPPLWAYDGAAWRALGIDLQGADVLALGAFEGRLYIGTKDGKIVRMTGAHVPPSAVDGAASAAGRGLFDLVSSTNGEACGGTGPCGATNQTRFFLSDRAGNVRFAGPYAVRVDTAIAVAASTPAFPVSGAYVSLQPNFSWIGASTKTIAAVAGGAAYLLEAALNDPAFAPASIVVRISTPAAVTSTSAATVDGLYVSTFTLADASTYYWRVRARSGIGSQSPWSATASFVTDFSSPSAGAFATVGSTGGALSETQYTGLTRGVTAQLSLSDGVSGFTNGAFPFTGDGHDGGGLTTSVGAVYSNDAGQTWVEISTFSEVLPFAAGYGHALAEFNGRLYAGYSSGELYRSADGVGWENAATIGPVWGGLAVFKGRLYAAISSGEIKSSVDGATWQTETSLGWTPMSFMATASKLYVAGQGGRIYESRNGTAWTAVLTGPGEDVYSLALFNGRLFAGVEGTNRVYEVGGSTWAQRLDMGLPSNARVKSMAVHDGRLYAGNNPYNAVFSSTDGANWTSLSSPQPITGFASLNGRLYATTNSSQLIVIEGGAVRLAANVSNVLYAHGIGAFKGRLFGNFTNTLNTMSDIVRFTPPLTSVSGAGGATAAVLSATDLNLIQSTNSAVCGGVAPCGATNQVRFHYADRAGNLRSAGPFAVLVDSLTFVTVSTPASPGDSSYVKTQPSFFWTVASSRAVADLPPGSQYLLQVSQNDPVFDPANVVVSIATPAVVVNPSPPYAEGLYVSTFTLADNTTHYWRVATRNSQTGSIFWSSTSTFATDFTGPAASSFTVVSATGGLLGESQILGLLAGVTVQLGIQDAALGSGLAALGPPAPGTVGLWRFDEGSGPPVDRSGNGNHGALACQGGGCSPPLYAPGSTGGYAINFTASQAVTVSSAQFNFPTNSSFTIEAWIKPTSVAGGAIAGVGSATQGANYLLKLNASGLAFNNDSGSGYNSPPGAVVTGVWQHVAAVVQGSTISYYVNGTLFSRGVSATGIGNSGVRAHPFSIGAGVRLDSAYDTQFSGMIDDVRVLNYAASSAQLASEHAGGMPGGFQVSYSTTAGAGWTPVLATAAAGGAPWLALTGSPGSLAPETLSVRDLALASSTNTLVCAGASPCGATNQLRFQFSDRAGHLRAAGPYAVLIDTVALNASPVLLGPLFGTYVTQSRPTLSWALPPGVLDTDIGRYQVQVGIDPAFGALVVDDVNVLAKTYQLPLNLTQGVTFYWRVRAFDNLGLYSPFSPAGSFVLDALAPAAVGGSFASFNSSGAAVPEAGANDLLAGVTAQIQVVDSRSGLSIPSPPRPATGTLAEWPLDEGAGTAAADASGGGNGGTVGNPRWTVGRVGAGLYVDSDDSALQGPNVLALAGGFTYEAWVRPDGTAPGSMGVVLGQGNLANQAYLGLPKGMAGLTDDRFNFWMTDSGSGLTAAAVSTSPLVAGRWYHLAATHAGGVMRLYVDGVLHDQKNFASTSGSLPFAVGRHNSPGHYFRGVIDHPRVSTGALDAGAVSEDYRRGAAAPFYVEYSTNAGAAWRRVDFTFPWTSTTPYVTLTGSYGSTSTETLRVSNLALGRSAGGGTGAAGSNQVRFVAFDLAGSSAALGPYAVIVDTIAPVAVPLLTEPTAGGFVRLAKPALRWALPAAVNGPDIAGFQVQVAASPGMSPLVVDEAAVAASPLVSPLNLTSGSTYYWRARSRDAIGVFSPFSSTASFRVDTVAPAASAFVTYDSSGQARAEAQLNDLASPVTAQVTVSDSDSGIAKPSPPRLVASTTLFWHLDEAAGVAAADASGWGNTGTLQQGASWVPGRVNAALQLDGVDDYAQGPNIPLTGDFTLEAWVNPATTAQAGRGGILGQGSGNSQMYLGLPNPGQGAPYAASRFNFWLMNGTPTPAVVASTFTPAAGVWYHLAAVYQTGAMSLYVNGALQDSRVFARASDTLPFFVGRTNLALGDYFAGKIDEVRVVASALTAEQVRQDWVDGSSLPFWVEVSTDAGASWAIIDKTYPSGPGQPYVELAGMNGATGAVPLKAYNLSLAESSSPAVGAGGTNQLRFVFHDLAENRLTAGPFSVLADSVAAQAVPQPLSPIDAGLSPSTGTPLTWTLPAGLGSVREYSVEVALDGGFASLVLNPTVSSRSYVANGLSQGATYYWRARSRTLPGGLSAFSAPRSFYVDAIAPSVTAFRSYSSTGGALAQTQWSSLTSGVTAQATVQQSGTGARGLAVSTGTFYVEVSTDAGVSWRLVVSTWATPASTSPYVTLTGADGTTAPQTLTAYNLELGVSTSGAVGGLGTNLLRVSAASLSGKPVRSVFSVLVDTLAPSVPSFASIVSPDSGQLRAQLNASTDPLSGLATAPYHIQLSSDAFGAVLADTGWLSASSATFTGLAPGVTYSVRARARDALGNVSAFSAPSNFNLANRIEASTANAAAPVALQGQVAPLLRLGLYNSGGATPWDSLQLTSLGPRDLDVYELLIYSDSDSDGVFDPPGSAAPDVQISESNRRFAGGSATVRLLAPQTILPSTKTYFVAARLDGLAVIGNGVGVRVPDPAAFQPISAGAAALPIQSSVSRVEPGPAVLTLTPADLTPEVIAPGTANAPLLRLLARTDQYTAEIGTFTVLLATGVDRDISGVKVYRDDGDGSFNPALDSLLSSGSDLFQGRVATITLTAAQSLRTIGPTQSVLYLAADISGGADEGDAASFSIPSSTWVRLASATNTVSTAGFPIQTRRTTLITQNTLWAALTQLDSALPAVLQGDTYTFARIDLRTDIGLSYIDRVTLTRSGLSFDSDVSEVALWRDQDDNRIWSPSLDAFLSSGSFSGGVAALDFAAQLVQTSTASLFVRLKVHAGAVADNTIGLKLANTAALRPSVSYTTVAPSPFPLSTSAPAISATVNRLSASVLDVSPGGALQGARDVPLLRLALSADRNLVRVTGLRVGRTGTALDSDLSAVKVYLGPPAFSVGASTLVSSGLDTFSGAAANVFLLSSLVVTPATSYAYLVADVAPTAGAGRTFGLTVSTSADVSVNAPNLVDPAAPFPIAGATVPIQKFPDVVRAYGTPLAPASASSGLADLLVQKLVLRSTLVDVGVTQVKVSKSGTLTDGEIADIRLWRDANADGALDVFGDVLVTSQPGRFVSGVATLPLVSARALPGGATYLMLLSLSTTAVVGRSVSLSLQADSLAVESPSSADYSNFPIQVPPLTVSKPVTTLNAAVESLAPATTAQGRLNVPMLKLRLWAQAYTVDFNGLVVARLGTASDSDVSGLRLYRDSNGSGALEPTGAGADALVSLAVASFATGRAVLSLSTQVIAASTATYFLAMDLSPIAVAGNTVALQIASPSGIQLAPPDVTGGTDFPLTSSYTAVSPTVTGVFASIQDLSPPSLAQGAAHQLLASLTLNTTAHAALWRSLRLTQAGTAQDNDITALNLWKDVNGNFVFEPGTDTLLTGGADRFLGGVATLQLLDRETIGQAGARYFLSADVNLFADSTRAFGVRVASAAQLEIESPNFAVASSFPVQTSLVPIAKLKDTLYSELSDVVPTAVNQGQDSEMLRVRLWAGRDRVYLTRWKVGRLGSIADADVAAVHLTLDVNGNGLKDALDVLVASTALLGGQAQFVFSPQETITTSTRTYFVSYVVSASAALGRLAGAEMSNASYLTLPTPDVAAALGGVTQSSLATIADARTPSRPVLTLPARYWRHFDHIDFVWVSTVGVGAITSAEYAIGTAPNGTDVSGGFVALPDPGRTSVTVPATLLTGTTYYVSLKARSGFGMTSPIGTSDALLVDSMRPPAPRATVTPGDSAVLLTWSIDWTGPSGVLGFLVEYRTGSSPQWRNAKTGKASPSALAFGPGAEDGRRLEPAGASPAEAYTLAISSDELVQGSSFAVTPPAGTVFVRMRAVSGSGVVSDATTVTKLQLGALPKDGLTQVSNYPNPFDSRKEVTRFNFTLSADSEVTIKIFNLFGSKITELKAPAGGPGGQAGSNDVPWDGTDSSGRRVAKGMYLAVIEAGGARVVQKVGVIH